MFMDLEKMPSKEVKKTKNNTKPGLTQAWAGEGFEPNGSPEPHILTGGIAHDFGVMHEKISIPNGYRAGLFEAAYNPHMWTDMFMGSGPLENHLWPPEDEWLPEQWPVEDPVDLDLGIASTIQDD